MKTWGYILVLVISAVSSFGAGLGPPITHGPFTTNTVTNIFFFHDRMTYSQVTNAAVSLPPSIKRHFTPGLYIIPTNSISWMRPNVTNLFHFEEGAFIFYGIEADTSGGQLAPGHGLFYDTGGSAKLIVSGAGTFIASNKWGPIVSMHQAGSKIEFSANNCIRANTNTGASCFFIEGDGELKANVLGDVENYGYDGIWNETGLGTINFQAGRIYCGDTMIEYGTSAIRPHFYRIGIIEKRNMVHNRPIGLQIGDNVFIKAGIVNLHSNSFISLVGFGFYPGCMEADYILCDADSNASLLNNSTANYRFKGAFMMGPDNKVPIFPGTGCVLENCTLSMGIGSSIETNLVGGAGGEVIRVVGTLDRANGSLGYWPTNLVFNGGAVLGMPHTNTYSAANVPIFLNGPQKQVLIATNSATLNWSAAPELLSGKEIEVAVYNNKATNMTLTHGGGVRVFGQLSTIVTNGRAVIFKASVNHTNINVTALQQQN